MNENARPYIEQILSRWAALKLGFDARALRLDPMVQAAREEIDRMGSLAAFESALARRDPEVEAPLVAATTVGETYFFRQSEHFELLAKLPIPAQGPVRAWSAGCATGEEAYSMAAVLRRIHGLDSGRLEVWGTDINPKAVQAARDGVYGRWSWRQNGAPALQENEALALEKDTRACVRFAQHNLLERADFEGGEGERFDLVFCRNVLVYFSAKAAAQAVAHIHRVLKPGAWLVLGNMDLGAPPAGFTRVGPPALCVFAKSHPVGPVPVVAEGETRPQKPPLPMEDLDPVDWHRAVLAEMEVGNPARGMRELQGLVEVFPDYLPGLFENALALRRNGQTAAAEFTLQELLLRALNHDLNEILRGPEPISLEFYVTSAKSFLESTGGGR